MKCVNSGNAYGINEPGWVDKALTDIKGQRPLCVMISAAAALSIASHVKDVAKSIPSAANIVELVTGGGPVPAPDVPMMLAVFGAFGGAVGTLAMVAARAASTGMRLSFTIPLPSSLGDLGSGPELHVEMSPP